MTETLTALRFALDDLEAFGLAAFRAAGADEATAAAVTRAMMHGSRTGIDSHGMRFLPHYVETVEQGRCNPHPAMTPHRRFGAVATLDADYGHGALATYRAMDLAMEIAETQGIGAVGVQKSSHFGPAGAFALAAAEKGYIGLVACNTDAYVRLHDGAEGIHGTNPLACAVPSAGERPWLLDMATSSIPRNRVALYQTLGKILPEGVASDSRGVDTTDPAHAEMLAPLGGAFGFKGAGLAGLVEILSAVLTGMQLCFDLAPMFENLDRTRDMGTFVVALRPDAFVDRATFDAGLRRYLDTLRGSAARADCRVLAPGDREWEEADRRATRGAPLAPEAYREYREIAARYGLKMPEPLAD